MNLEVTKCYQIQSAGVEPEKSPIDLTVLTGNQPASLILCSKC